MKHRKAAAPRDNTGVVDEAQRRIAQDGSLVEDTRHNILAFMSYLQVEGLKPDSIAGYATTLRRLASFCPGNEFLYLEREDQGRQDSPKGAVRACRYHFTEGG